MAGNQNSGRVPTFKLSEGELTKKINAYKRGAEAGDKYRPSWPHFCAFLGYTEEEIAEVMALSDTKTSAYKPRGLALRRMATWVRGEILSSTSWDGQQTKAAAALRKDNGDGVSYSDRAGNQDSGEKTIEIRFGGADRRARDAAK